MYINKLNSMAFHEILSIIRALNTDVIVFQYDHYNTRLYYYFLNLLLGQVSFKINEKKPLRSLPIHKKG